MQGRDSNAAPALHASPLCPLHLNRPKSVKDVPGLKCQPCARLHIIPPLRGWSLEIRGSVQSLSERYWRTAAVGLVLIFLLFPGFRCASPWANLGGPSGAGLIVAASTCPKLRKYLLKSKVSDIWAQRLMPLTLRFVDYDFKAASQNRAVPLRSLFSTLLSLTWLAVGRRTVLFRLIRPGPQWRIGRWRWFGPLRQSSRCLQISGAVWRRIPQTRPVRTLFPEGARRQSCLPSRNRARVQTWSG